MLPEVKSLLWVLVVTIVILALAYWFTRYVVGRLAGGKLLGRQSRISVLEQISVGKEQRLMLVQMGDKVYLLGVTPGGITCLETLPADEVAGWTAGGNIPDAPPSSMGFREALRSVMKQRKQ